MIVGDMDSVSDTTLRKGAELVVHAYPDGRAPGLRRIQEQGLKAHVLPLPGTSEDVAMLLAYEKGAALIVTVGSHSNMIDFLEKGRRGMASTLLVRLKVEKSWWMPKESASFTGDVPGSDMSSPWLGSLRPRDDTSAAL